MNSRIGPGCLAIALALVACDEPKKSADPSKPPANTTSSTKPAEPAPGHNPVTAPVDYLGAISKAKQVSEKTIDTSAVNQAIQLFAVQEGRNPKDLAELVSKQYLRSIPAPPYGMKYEYDAAAGKARIVSAK
jgi:hypothetical protein